MTEFRDFTAADRAVFLRFCREFYSGDAVEHPIPQSYMEDTFEKIIEGSPYLRGILFVQADEPVGYCQLSFTYSNEAGGFVVLGEELYVCPEHQGQGIGKEFFRWLRNSYDGKATRYRLEVCEDNVRAIGLYRKEGFEVLPYGQMILGR